VFGKRTDGLDVLLDFVKKFKTMTPFVSIYAALCISCLDWCPTRIQADKVLEMLNFARFL
jgi:hypothetical protein